MDPTCALLAPPGGCRACGAPLPDGARSWCSRGCRDWYRRNHYWEAARQARLAADGWACVVCLAEDSSVALHVHHLDPVGELGYGAGCQHHQDGLVTLCRQHHGERHGTRPRQLSLVA